MREMVDLLLTAGANAKAVNRYGVPPLSLAAVNGNAGIVQQLLDAAGADAEHRAAGRRNGADDGGAARQRREPSSC